MTAESDGEKCLKIGQYLSKLWAIKQGVVFMKEGVVWAIVIAQIYCSCLHYATETLSYTSNKDVMC